MLTPRAQALWANFSVNRRDKQIAELYAKKALFKSLREDTNKLAAFNAARLTYLMAIFSMTIVIMFITITIVQFQTLNEVVRLVVSVLALIVFTYVNIEGMRYKAMFDNISLYEEYEVKIDKQIESLQKIGQPA